MPFTEVSRKFSRLPLFMASQSSTNRKGLDLLTNWRMRISVSHLIPFVMSSVSPLQAMALIGAFRNATNAIFLYCA